MGKTLSIIELNGGLLRWFRWFFGPLLRWFAPVVSRKCASSTVSKTNLDAAVVSDFQTIFLTGVYCCISYIQLGYSCNAISV